MNIDTAKIVLAVMSRLKDTPRKVKEIVALNAQQPIDFSAELRRPYACAELAIAYFAVNPDALQRALHVLNREVPEAALAIEAILKDMKELTKWD